MGKRTDGGGEVLHGEVVSSRELANREDFRPSGLVELADLEPEQVLERVQRWTKAIEQLSIHALKSTQPRHWTNYRDTKGTGEGQPWLTGPGAEVLIAKMGLRVEFDEPAFEVEQGEDTEGPWFLYTCRVVVSLGRWAAVSATGHCSSRDQFLSRGGRLTAGTVNRESIKQSAYTNALVNGVGRVLGLRRLTWEDVRKLTGFGSEAVESADHSGGARGGQRKGGPAAPGQAAELASAAARAALWRSYCEGKQVDPKVPPEGEADRFRAWVLRVAPEVAKLKREEWTVDHVAKLREAAKQLAPDALDVPDGAGFVGPDLGGEGDPPEGDDQT